MHRKFWIHLKTYVSVCIKQFPPSGKEEGRIKRNRRKHQFSLESKRRIPPPTPTRMAANC